MPQLAAPTLTDPLSGLIPDAVVDEWHWRRLDELSDSELVETAAAHVAVPRRDPADSFVLHAPLELMARSALLRFVEPTSREQARQRIVWVAATYDCTDPAELPDVADGAAMPSLDAAIAAGDLDGVDVATRALTAATTAADLVAALADAVVPRLSAAGHGSIFLYHLPRLLAASPAAASMARGLLREVGRQPSWRLTWMDGRPSWGVPTGDLAARLLTPIDAGDPSSPFIYPTMSLVERTGQAAEVLDAPTRCLPVADARRDLLRVAAWSMLQDDPAHAPYGWSHTLTMPQATLAVAPASSDPSRAVAVAATYVLGFRSTLGAVTLDPRWTPEPVSGLDALTYLDAGPDAAAAAMWHVGGEEYGAYVRRLVTVAGRHEDAHLAKYTLACLDATRDDPAAGRLFMAAAAFLAGWWRQADAG
jgi:hypothetical protein